MWAAWNSSVMAILSLVMDRLGHKRVECRHADSSVRRKSHQYIRTMTMKRLREHGILQVPSVWTKPWQWEQYFGRIFSYLETRLGAILIQTGRMQMYFCLPEPEIVSGSFRIEIWLSTCLTLQVLRNIANLLEVWTAQRSSETTLCSLVMDKFWNERVRCRHTDSMVRPKGLHCICAPLLERLKMYKTSQVPSEWTKLGNGSHFDILLAVGYLELLWNGHLEPNYRQAWAWKDQR